MTLKEYRKKRNLKKSGEPSSRRQKSRRGKSGKEKHKLPRFVIHEHHASHLHWDLRLEMDRVLKSWAVPKPIPLSKGEKRLAIQVEDHPLSYAKFKGVIPEGNYGAGTVLIWDKGKYKLEERTPKKILVDFKGKKLKGKYCLIKTNYGGIKSGWLFFKL